jgi:hypothetical protein
MMLMLYESRVVIHRCNEPPEPDQIQVHPRQVLLRRKEGGVQMNPAHNERPLRAMTKRVQNIVLFPSAFHHSVY